MAGVIELGAGQARMRLCPGLGGRITALRLLPRGAAEAQDVLLPFPEDTRPESLLHWPKGGIYPLVPYGNRIRDGRLLFGGREHRLPAHPDAAPHTLHGHAHRVAWQVAQAAGNAAEWVLEHGGGEEWPWRFRAGLSAVLAEDRLVVEASLRNDGAEPMPCGLGLHPYFLHDADDLVGFRTTTEWPATADFLAGPPRPTAPDYDPPRALPAGAVTLYRSGWDGECQVRRARGGLLRLRADPLFDHLVVHRPEGGGYLCLEPTSHSPDGFNAAEAGVAGTGRRVLGPGEALRASLAISLEA